MTHIEYLNIERVADAARLEAGTRPGIDAHSVATDLTGDVPNGGSVRALQATADPSQYNLRHYPKTAAQAEEIEYSTEEVTLGEAREDYYLEGKSLATTNTTSTTRTLCSFGTFGRFRTTSKSSQARRLISLFPPRGEDLWGAPAVIGGMMGIDNGRVEEECGVNPMDLKETFRAIVLDIESQSHAEAEEFAVNAEAFSPALECVMEIPIAATASVALDNTLRAKRELRTIVEHMHNEAYATMLEEEVIQPLEALDSFFTEAQRHSGQESVEAQ